MDKLLAAIARWLLKQAASLVVVVVILLAGLWLTKEWNGLQGRRDAAEKNESLAHRLTLELEPLEEQIGQAKAQLKDVGNEIGSKEIRIERARKAEELALKNLQDVRDQKRWFYNQILNPDYYIKLQKAELAHKLAKAGTAVAHEDLGSLKRRISESDAGRELERLVEKQSQKLSDIRNLTNQSLGIREELAARPIEKLRTHVLSVLPTALVVVAAAILAPLLIKAVLYYCLAPLISRTKPVLIMPRSSGDVEVSQSAVSVPITLKPDEELIVHSDFLQAAGAGPGKRTRWLLSWKMPLTSMAAGLYMMVAVRNRGDSKDRVTVSPKEDLFDMICDVSLPEGSSMVIYPRSLVGIVLKNGSPPRITRHWNLLSLHSWVTFQFRYIVIHGQSRFLIKGCRGVRAEHVEPANPRMQDKGATLGFTANLAYSGVRCETFIDYLRGRDELFNDRFSDADGYHFAEEVPRSNRRTGLFGRGLEGVFDGILKAFGI